MQTQSRTHGPTAYTVRFFKKLCNDAGHEHRALQGQVRVREAASHVSAIDLARKEFARRRRIPRHVVLNLEAEALADKDEA